LELEKIEKYKESVICALKTLFKVFNILANKKDIKIYTFEDMVNNKLFLKFNYNILDILKNFKINQFLNINNDILLLNKLIEDIENKIK